MRDSNQYLYLTRHSRNQTGIEIPISKSQIPNNFQSPNDQIPNKPISVIRNWNLNIVWDLVLGDWCF
jgi:hypothetical protein